jgi:hypothetical protein
MDKVRAKLGVFFSLLKSPQSRVVAAICVFFLVCVGGVLFTVSQVDVGAVWKESSLVHFLSGTGVPSGADYLVLYTDKGFTPGRLEVPVGARVAFRNKTKIGLWVGADPHPTHTDYPDFVAPAEIGPGQQFIFHFTREGTFGYGNDGKTVDHATIRVFDPANPVPEISTLSAGEKVTRDRLLSLYVVNDPNSIFKVIDAIGANKTLSLNCHEIAHDLGHRAYELYGFSGAMTYTNPARVNHVSVQDVCAGGYVHGILEQVSLHQPEFKNDPGMMCENVPAGNRESCFHGVGHALMFAYNRDTVPALTACRSLGKGINTTRCFEGVWMELFWGSTEHSGVDTLGWDVTAPLAPCIASGPDAKPACFIYSSFGYLRTHPKDYAGAIHECTQNALNDSDSTFCLKGVGITMVSHFKGHQLEQSESLAALLTPDQKHAFYLGEMGYAVFSGISRTELQSSCNLFVKDGDLCRQTVQEAAS